MFDSNSQGQSQSQSVTFNSVAGTIVKSHAKSKMIRFHMNSPMAGYVFDEKDPRISQYGKTEITVLQVMLCGGEQFIVEYVNLDDLMTEGGPE